MSLNRIVELAKHGGPNHELLECLDALCAASGAPWHEYAFFGEQIVRPLEDMLGRHETSGIIKQFLRFAETCPRDDPEIALKASTVAHMAFCFRSATVEDKCRATITEYEIGNRPQDTMNQLRWLLEIYSKMDKLDGVLRARAAALTNG